MDILSLFLTTSLIEQIAINTNAYATQKIAEREQEGGRKWGELLAGGLRVWLGIIIYMGVHCSPAVMDYWKHDGLNPTHPIRDYMGLTRFEKIKRYFHVTPPDAPQESATGRWLWHNMVEPVLDQLRQSSKRYRVPSTHVSLDECMMHATGASKGTYKIPSKPIG